MYYNLCTLSHRHLYKQARVSVPPLILSDVAVLELLHCALQHLVGIIGEVQVPDLRQGNGHDGERLLVLFRRTGTDLLSQPKQ